MELQPLRAARSIDAEIFDYTETGFTLVQDPIPKKMPHAVLSSQKRDSSPYLMPTNICDYLVGRQVGFSSAIAVHAWVTLRNLNGVDIRLVFICPIIGWATANVDGKCPPEFQVEFTKFRKSFGLKGNVFWEVRITSVNNSSKLETFI